MKHKFVEIIKNIKYSFQTAYLISNKFFIGKIIVTFAQTGVSIVQIYTLAGMIDEIVKLVDIDPVINYKFLMLMVGMYLLSYIALNTIVQINEYLDSIYSDAVKLFMDNLLVDKLSEVDFSFFDSSELQEQVNDSWGLTDSIQAVVWQFFALTKAGIEFLIGIVLLSRLSIPVAILVTATMIPAMYFQNRQNDVRWGYERNAARDQRKMDYYKEQMSADVDTFNVRMFSMSDFFIKKYMIVWKRWQKNLNRKSLISTIISGISMLFLYLGEVGVLLCCIARVQERILNIGGLTYYVSILAKVRESSEQLIYLLMNIRYNYKEMKTVLFLINLESSMDKSGELIPEGRMDLEFKDVTFAYPGSNEYILKGCSFRIEKNEVVGLVGLNGSGKSTIVKLILRLYDPIEGEILLNGINIKKFNVDKLRYYYGVLFQDYNKYSFSLRESIGLSDIKHFSNEICLWEACKNSSIEKLVNELPEGLETQLTRRFSEKGAELSGGQWQRVALARLFFGKRSFFLLDEPSSALDPIAEHEIFQMFKKLSKDKNSLLITHRLSNITIADKIIVLEDGKVVEQGSHEYLMEKKGKYFYLFKLQSEQYIKYAK